MLNRSDLKRTLSAFAFERIDAEDVSEKRRDHFDGYIWDNGRGTLLLPNYCVSITIYGDQTPPYVDPADCSWGIVYGYQPRFDNDEGLVFWRPEGSSTHFRVLWLGEELARCEIAAGFCDFRVP